MVTDSRRKGRNAEREVELLFQAAGFQTDRNIGGRRQVSGDIAVADPRLAIEVRRRERLLVPTWCDAHETACPPDAIPLLAFKANRMPWRAALLLDDLLTLIGKDAPTERHP